MAIDTHRPLKEIDLLNFKVHISDKSVVVASHALDHLSNAQRKVFKEEDLIEMLTKETPRKIYLQANGRFSPYYRRSDGYRRLIIDIDKDKVTIVTFTDPDVLPKVHLRKNGK